MMSSTVSGVFPREWLELSRVRSISELSFCYGAVPDSYVESRNAGIGDMDEAGYGASPALTIMSPRLMFTGISSGKTSMIGKHTQRAV